MLLLLFLLFATGAKKKQKEKPVPWRCGSVPWKNKAATPCCAYRTRPQFGSVSLHLATPRHAPPRCRSRVEARRAGCGVAGCGEAGHAIAIPRQPRALTVHPRSGPALALAGAMTLGCALAPIPHPRVQNSHGCHQSIHHDSHVQEIRRAVFAPI